MSGIFSNYTIAGGGGSGESNTASNVGTAGVGSFKVKSGVDLQFKKFNAASSKLSIVDNTGVNQIDFDVVPANLPVFLLNTRGVVPGPTLADISADKVLQADGTWVVPAAASGEANTASNINTAGVGVFDHKAGVDLQFKGIKAASTKIVVANSTSDKTVSVDVDTTQLSTFTVGSKGVVPAPVSGDVSGNKVLRADGTWVTPASGSVASVNTRSGAVTLVGTDIPVFVASGGSHAVGAVPDPGSSSGTVKYLREDATWATPPGTTYSNFVASGGSHASGLVPDPGSVAGSTKFLCEDGTWATPAGGGGGGGGGGGSNLKYIRFEEQYATGVYPPDSWVTGTWTQRKVNTLVTDETSSASISSNNIVLPAGTYQILIRAPFLSTGRSRVRLYNVTDSSVALTGGTGLHVNSAITAAIYFEASGKITLSGTKTLQIQYYIESAGNPRNGGVEVSDGSTEVYSIAEVWKVETVASTSIQRVVIKDERSNGTAGGIAPSTNTWYTRTLQTLELDEIGSVTLSSNQFTLPAGTYDIDADVIFCTLSNFAVRLYNVTDSAVTLKGTTGYGGSAGAASVTGHIGGTFTIAGSKTFRIEAISSAPSGTSDNGKPSTNAAFGTEVYTVVSLALRS